MNPGSFRPKIESTGAPQATPIWTGPESLEITSLARFKSHPSIPMESFPERLTAGCFIKFRTVSARGASS